MQRPENCDGWSASSHITQMIFKAMRHVLVQRCFDNLHTCVWQTDIPKLVFQKVKWNVVVDVSESPEGILRLKRESKSFGCQQRKQYFVCFFFFGFVWCTENRRRMDRRGSVTSIRPLSAWAPITRQQYHDHKLQKAADSTFARKRVQKITLSLASSLGNKPHNSDRGKCGCGLRQGATLATWGLRSAFLGSCQTFWNEPHLRTFFHKI